MLKLVSLFQLESLIVIQLYFFHVIQWPSRIWLKNKHISVMTILCFVTFKVLLFSKFKLDASRFAGALFCSFFFIPMTLEGSVLLKNRRAENYSPTFCFKHYINIFLLLFSYTLIVPTRHFIYCYFFCSDDPGGIGSAFNDYWADNQSLHYFHKNGW